MKPTSSKKESQSMRIAFEVGHNFTLMFLGKYRQRGRTVTKTVLSLLPSCHDAAGPKFAINHNQLLYLSYLA